MVDAQPVVLGRAGVAERGPLPVPGPGFRFGLIGNCVDRTICVFGPPLIDALLENPPEMFRRPAWTFEERREKQEQWAKRGWMRLTGRGEGRHLGAIRPTIRILRELGQVRWPGHPGADAITHLGHVPGVLGRPSALLRRESRTLRGQSSRP